MSATPATSRSRPVVAAVASGLVRGVIEFRHLLTHRTDLLSSVGWGLLPTAVLIVFWRQGETITVGDTSWPYVLFATPGMLAVVIAFAAISPMYYLAAEREDGTLLRARAMPHGLVGYTVGRVVTVSLEAALGLLLVLVPALLLFDGMTEIDAAGWATVLWVFFLGLAAIVPIGLLIGSLLRSTKGIFSFGLVIIGTITVVSGIYQPLEAWPGWVQGVAKVLPVYWIGHGMRAAFLPDVMAAVEVGGAWRLWLAFAVIGAWALLGIAVAPLVLRRAARRQSASLMAQRRERALHQSV